MHIPVLLEEILRIAEDICPKIALDGTFGRGGHSRALLQKFSELKLIGFDRDPEAIEAGKKMQLEFPLVNSDGSSSSRLSLYYKNYSEYVSTDFPPLDFALLDLGVSSPQLDTAARGFSFYGEGPLDMRMNPNEETETAADIINYWQEKELVTLFQDLGEIHAPFKVVRAILSDRKTKPFTTTTELSGLIERVDGWQKKGFHPATNYFMALRMKVNRELENLEIALENLMAGLRAEGRLAVVTFHSLEDRIVKNAFRNQPNLGVPLFKKVIVPSEEEMERNPRSRSAKLRVFLRSDTAGATRGRRNKYPRSEAGHSQEDT